MSALLAILTGPSHAGLLFPNIWFAIALVLLKLFDAWSTNYIVGRKGGVEKDPLTAWFIKIAGSVKGGMTLDFALCTAVAWLGYPWWWIIGGVAAWYAYWMALQWGQVRQAQPK